MGGRFRCGLARGAALIALVALGSCAKPPQPAAPGVAPSVARQQGPTGGGAARAAQAASPGFPYSPDPRITPGDVLPVTAHDICQPGYSKKVRNVPESVKKQAYANYGIATHAPGEYEVDHLISLELGGSNSIRNLWPESYVSEPWNAHVKDRLENELHREVCGGQIDLKTAQQEIATDWIAAYKQRFGTDLPVTKAKRSRGGRAPAATDQGAPEDEMEGLGQPAPPGPAQTGVGTDEVWVNTRSGKYFRPGSRYFRNTKEGALMPEAQAKSQGYTAARE